MNKSDSELLELLTSFEGYSDSLELLEVATYDSIVPGICRICETTADCEPDARRNYCDNCTAQAVESCLSLAGII